MFVYITTNTQSSHLYICHMTKVLYSTSVCCWGLMSFWCICFLQPQGGRLLLQLINKHACFSVCIYLLIQCVIYFFLSKNLWLRMTKVEKRDYVKLMMFMLWFIRFNGSTVLSRSPTVDGALSQINRASSLVVHRDSDVLCG